MDYIAAGNVMSDIIEREDGSRSAHASGRPAFFALAGIRAVDRQRQALLRRRG